MARISYLTPDEVSDPEMRQWLEESIEKGVPGPEIQAIRAHNKVVMRSFNMLEKTMKEEGVLEPELRELVLTRMGTSWQRMYGIEDYLYFRVKNAAARMATAPSQQRISLLDNEQSYLKSDLFTHREKIALRYCDAIIENPLYADDELWELLHKEFSEPELVELGHYIGFMSGGQRWLITLNAEHGALAQLMEQKKAGA